MNELTDDISSKEGKIKKMSEKEMWDVIRNSKSHCFLNLFINCNDEPYDVDDVNTPISRTDVNVFM